MLNPADDQFVAKLQADLPANTVGPAPARYVEEQRGLLHGVPAVLARPRTALEVARVLKLCARARVAVIPFSGGTGLVGGHVIEEGPTPLVLSLERMNAIRSVDPDGNTLIAEAGAILQDVQSAAEDVNRLFPLSLASEGSCCIGGNLATNAGGVQVLRYGNARDLCLGIEAVLPDGSIHHGLKRLRKDNTGYDLRNLLIGAEGTLGVITAASPKLFARPKETATAFVVVPSPKAAVRLLGQMQDRLDGLVSVFELIHGQGFEFLSETMPQVRLPFSGVPEWMVLTEVRAGAEARISDRLTGVLGDCLESGLVQDVLLAQNLSQREAFWTVRESIPIANKLVGAINSHDISVPIAAVPAFIEEGRGVVAGFGDVRLNCFGHLGDGNLHYNVYPPKGANRADYMHLKPAIQKAVHDLVQAYEGSFSAEHGIGRVKAADLLAYGDPAKISAMRAIKTALDPVGIMNPGAVISPV